MKKKKLVIKKLSSKNVYLNKKIYKKLKELTLVGKNESEWSHFDNDLINKRAGKFFIAYQGSEIIAWTIISRRDKTKYQAGFYVLPSLRRKGIGSKLIAKAIAFAQSHKKKLYVSSWDNRSNAFFKNFATIKNRMNSYTYAPILKNS
jgi:GNAT superfamily N-acetyltransferase